MHVHILEVGLMFCALCGVQNRDDAKNCQACGAALKANPYQTAGVQPAGSVPNHLWAAILTTVFCFFPFGIVAIVYAIQVNNNLARGDYQAAMQSSSAVKMWCWLSAVLGLAFYLVVVVFYLFFSVRQIR
jgi:hypothetical protein